MWKSFSATSGYFLLLFFWCFCIEKESLREKLAEELGDKVRSINGILFDLVGSRPVVLWCSDSACEHMTQGL